jgi:hypothetical protein
VHEGQQKVAVDFVRDLAFGVFHQLRHHLLNFADSASIHKQDSGGEFVLKLFGLLCNLGEQDVGLVELAILEAEFGVVFLGLERVIGKQENVDVVLFSFVESALLVPFFQDFVLSC